MTLQTFLESTRGQIVVVAIIVLIFLIILIGGRRDKKKVDTKTLVICALLTALAVVLQFIKIFEMPQGGSITLFSMVPIVLAGYFFGLRRGVMVGVAFGLLKLIFGPYVIHPVQLLLDYPLAFGALAIGAPLRRVGGKASLSLVYVVGVLGRAICAVLSGVIFFGAYAPDDTNVWVYSIGYNAVYLLVEGGISLVLLNVPQIRSALEHLRERVTTH